MLLPQPPRKWRHTLEGLAVTIGTKDKRGDAVDGEVKPQAKYSVLLDVEVPKYGRPVSDEGKTSGPISSDSQVEVAAWQIMNGEDYPFSVHSLIKDLGGDYRRNKLGMGRWDVQPPNSSHPSVERAVEPEPQKQVCHPHVDDNVGRAYQVTFHADLQVRSQVRKQVVH